tara:strand:- start:28111 stop:28947 length:837 start_codon:yes stop_codon:yes gene_type:complete
MYGVGGIPHTQWNGVEETTGGYPDGNWQPMYNSFLPIYNSMVGVNTPYEIDINGLIDDITVSYDVTVTMDSEMSNANQKVDIFVVEDNIWSYWTGSSSYHHARNVARDWLASEDLSISNSGETEMFSGTFELRSSWDPDSIKIISIVQNYASKQIYQAIAVNINDMDPDVDDDGIYNNDDNCVEIYNPDQIDDDNDSIGNMCDPCNNLVYVLGNINGDYTLDNKPIINLFDALALVDFLITNDGNECLMQVTNINDDYFINILDVVVLVRNILNGEYN